MLLSAFALLHFIVASACGQSALPLIRGWAETLGCCCLLVCLLMTMMMMMAKAEKARDNSAVKGTVRGKAATKNVAMAQH